MSQANLEERVAALEKQVVELLINQNRKENSKD
jgi:hypothetical protein